MRVFDIDYFEDEKPKSNNQMIYKLMLRQVNFYKENKISLRQLTSDIRILISSLEEDKNVWEGEIYDCWAELETIYAPFTVYQKDPLSCAEADREYYGSGAYKKDIDKTNNKLIKLIEEKLKSF